MPTDPTKTFQRIPDYQILVDAQDNASTLLEMDKTEGASLREFVESLDVNEDGIITIDDLSKADAAAVIKGVTLEVDGVEATVVKTDRDIALTLELDAVREVEKVTAVEGGSVALEDIVGGGKKLNVAFPTVEDVSVAGTKLVFHHAEAYSASAVPFSSATQTIVSFTSVDSAIIKPGFEGAYNVSSGYFTIPSGEGGAYLVLSNLRFHLGSFQNIHAGYNWDHGLRASGGGVLALACGTDHSSAAGLFVGSILQLGEGATVGPYFYHEEGNPATKPYAQNLNFSIFKIEM